MPKRLQWLTSFKLTRLVFWCLTTLSTTFHLYHDGQFHWWMKLEYLGENHPPVASHWQTLSQNVVSSTPCLSGFELTMLVNFNMILQVSLISKVWLMSYTFQGMISVYYCKPYIDSEMKNNNKIVKYFSLTCSRKLNKQICTP